MLDVEPSDLNISHIQKVCVSYASFIFCACRLVLRASRRLNRFNTLKARLNASFFRSAQQGEQKI